MPSTRSSKTSGKLFASLSQCQHGVSCTPKTFCEIYHFGHRDGLIHSGQVEKRKGKKKVGDDEPRYIPANLSQRACRELFIGPIRWSAQVRIFVFADLHFYLHIALLTSFHDFSTLMTFESWPEEQVSLWLVPRLLKG